MLGAIIRSAIKRKEIDLGIQWRDGAFWRSGAKLLDEALVNENFRWLSDPKYSTVVAPFEKRLHHFLEAQRQPEGYQIGHTSFTIRNHARVDTIAGGG